MVNYQTHDSRLNTHLSLPFRPEQNKTSRKADIMSNTRPISSFIEKHYLHFNAAALVDAAKAYKVHKASGKKMLVSLAGAMSTAELGKSLAEMIRQGKVDIISCTGANLEEDVMNLVAHDHYERVPHYRDLGPEDERALADHGMNRVTDTCIPEEEAFRRLEEQAVKLWKDGQDNGKRRFHGSSTNDQLRRTEGILQTIRRTAGWCRCRRNPPIVVRWRTVPWATSSLHTASAGAAAHHEERHRHDLPRRLVHGECRHRRHLLLESRNAGDPHLRSAHAGADLQRKTPFRAFCRSATAPPATATAARAQ